VTAGRRRCPGIGARHGARGGSDSVHTTLSTAADGCDRAPAHRAEIVIPTR
jgi:hypothetical protein